MAWSRFRLLTQRATRLATAPRAGRQARPTPQRWTAPMNVRCPLPQDARGSTLRTTHVHHSWRAGVVLATRLHLPFVTLFCPRPHLALLAAADAPHRHFTLLDGRLLWVSLSARRAKRGYLLPCLCMLTGQKRGACEPECIPCMCGWFAVLDGLASWGVSPAGPARPRAGAETSYVLVHVRPRCPCGHQAMADCAHR